MTLGKELPTFDSEWHRDEFLVQGCESKAWLLHYQDPTTNQHFWAFDSDARIVKGLVILILDAGKWPDRGRVSSRRHQSYY